MKRLVPLLLVLPLCPAAAQTRIRPMGEFRADSKGVSFVASFEARSTGEFVLDANERVDQPAFFSSSHCAIRAGAVARWADSTTTLVNQEISRPQAPEKIEYVGPELQSAECVIRVDRTIYASGSTYSLVVLSRTLILHASAVAPVTQPQALTFIGKVRGTAAVTLAMSTIAPGSPTNPTAIADASPAATAADQPYFEFQVEKQVAALPDNPRPRYPDMLRSANVEGEVLAQFVVDTNGRAEMNTFKVLKSSHDLFTNSVRSALATMRFYPAEIAGRKVRQLVQMPFVFGVGGGL